jgi:two-component SAPR family response regulator
MTDSFIAPPPELVQQWGGDAYLSDVNHNEEDWAYEQHIATRAAQWGADQELKACCELLRQFGFNETLPRLQRVRRPEPPSLKEEALKGFDTIADIVLDEYSGTKFYEKYKKVADTIKRALEALPE